MKKKIMAFIMCLTIIMLTFSSYGMAQAASSHTRVATGQGKTLNFEKGVTVFGSEIVINGKTYYDGYLVNVSAAGTVTTGVIWPWDAEIKNATKLTEIKEDSVEWKLGYEKYFWPGLGHKEYNGEYVNGVYSGNYYYTGRYIVLPGESLTTNTNVRVVTGVGQSRSFKAGESVCGYKIVFDNGKLYEDKCGYGVINSPYAGIVTDGVVNPTDSELSKVKIIDPKLDKPDNRSHLITDYRCDFNIGDTFVAKEIRINGKTFYNKLIVDSPYSGYFFKGILWPTASERSGYTTADPINDSSESRDRIVVNNNPVTFKKGDSVFGQVITIGDVTYKNTYIINANASGTVTYGTINPNSWEIPYGYGTVTFP